jgi:hypothetical protein
MWPGIWNTMLDWLGLTWTPGDPHKLRQMGNAYFACAAALDDCYLEALDKAKIVWLSADGAKGAGHGTDGSIVLGTDAPSGKLVKGFEAWWLAAGPKDAQLNGAYGAKYNLSTASGAARKVGQSLHARATMIEVLHAFYTAQLLSLLLALVFLGALVVGSGGGGAVVAEGVGVVVVNGAKTALTRRLEVMLAETVVVLVVLRDARQEFVITGQLDKPKAGPRSERRPIPGHKVPWVPLPPSTSWWEQNRRPSCAKPPDEALKEPVVTYGFPDTTHVGNVLYIGQLYQPGDASDPDLSRSASRVIEVGGIMGPPIDRSNFEDVLDAIPKGPGMDNYQRTHAGVGPWSGLETRAGIFYAPQDVNQSDMATIETHLRQFYKSYVADSKDSWVELQVTATAFPRDPSQPTYLAYSLAKWNVDATYCNGATGQVKLIFSGGVTVDPPGPRAQGHRTGPGPWTTLPRP